MAATTTTPPPPVTQAQLIAAILAALSAAVTAAGLALALAKIMKAAGVGYLALRAVAVLVMAWPADVMEGTGAASRWAVRTNALRRSQFFLSACRRVQQAITAARSRNEPVTDAVRAALQAEQRWMAAHIAACHKRTTAGSAVDGAASMYGNLLGWNAIIDAATTYGCRAANGQNFRADQPPVVEGSPSFPGAVHARCRCWPSAPHKGAPVMR